MSETKTKKYLLRFTKVLAWIFASFLVLFLVIVLLLQFSGVQTWITGKIVSGLAQRTQSTISIDEVAIRFPKSLGLKGIYLEDSQGDTLLYAGSIFVDISMLRLLKSTVEVNSLELTDVVARMKRLEGDTIYNFQFLIDSLTGSNDQEPPEPTVEEGGEPSWKVMVDAITLKNIRYILDDHLTGTNVNAGFAELTTDLIDSDVLNGRYYAGNTRIRGGIISLDMQQPSIPPPGDTASVMPQLDIALARLVLEDFVFSLSDFQGTQMRISAPLFDLDTETILLHEYHIGINHIIAESINAEFHFPQSQDATDALPANTDEPFVFDFADIMDWTISLDQFSITTSSFTMTRGDPIDANSFNPGDISLQDINIRLSDALISPSKVKLDLQQASINLSDKFRLTDLRAVINLGDSTLIDLQNLQTSQSKLSFAFNSSENFLQFSSEDLFNYPITLNIRTAQLRDDLAWLAPQLNDLYFGWSDNQEILAGGSISGSLSDLVARELWVEAPGYLSFRTSGSIKGLPQTEDLWVDLPSLRLEAAPAAILAHLPDTLLPEGFQPPGHIILTSSTRGSVKNFSTDTRLQSDLGDISLTASLGAAPGEQFTLHLHTDGFDAGRLLGQEETLSQPLAVDLQMKGAGLEPETMQAEALLSIGNLAFNGYHYDELLVGVQLSDSVVYLQSNYHDDNLSYDLEALYGLFKDHGYLHGDMVLGYARLDSLGFSENDLMVKTHIHSHIDFNVPSFFSGEIFIENTSLASGGEVFDFPGININSVSTPGNYNLSVRSELANIDFDGNFSPVEIPAELTRHLDYYYDIHQVDSLIGEEKHFNLEVRVNPNELISDVILSELESYDTLNLTVNYNNHLKQLRMNSSWEEITYGTMNLSQFSARVLSDRKSLDFYLQFDELTAGGITVHEFNSSGFFVDNWLNFDIGVRDVDSNPLYSFGGKVDFNDSISRLTLSSINMLINGEQWFIPDSNYIAYAPNYLDIKNFLLHSNDRQVALATRESPSGDLLLDLVLKQIDLGSFTDFAGDDQPTLSGLFDGEVTVINPFSQPALLANLEIHDFGFRGDTIGDVVVKAENLRSNIYDLFASVESDLTQLNVKGTYQTGEDTSIDMVLDLAFLDLPSLEGLAAGNLTSLQGNLSGRMHLTGSATDPILNGQLNINETRFTVPAINASYYLKNESLVFDRKTLRLRNIRIEDQSGNNAGINGNINFTDLDQVSFNINLNTNNFLLMDVEDGQNDTYHGRILMDSDLRLRGTIDSPVIDGRVKLNEGSNFTFVLPQSNPETIGDEGVVEFMQIGDTLFHRIVTQQGDAGAITSSFERLTVSVNLDIDRETDIRIIIDEYAGDFLEVEGGGLLSFGIDPGGRITLAGRYELEDGEYLLTFYDVIRRNFRIQSGSNITWTGDPMEANVDITAIYTLRTSARDLMVTHMTGDQANNPALRQQFPFNVLLKMQGNLSEPQISFEITLPDEHQNAFDGSLAARILQVNQNESELNKQVFALLIMGSFIQDNPFASRGGGGGFTSTARASASQILTQQLNRLSDRYVRGVDINFEVESTVDYTDTQAAGRTELQMEVSRNFFDDRVRVSVGGNIELEDETRRESNPGDIAGDFKIEYLLTPNGNLRLMGFRTRNWADIFDGQVYETGLALMFTRSYNQFRELFRPDRQPTENEETLIYDE